MKLLEVRDLEMSFPSLDRRHRESVIKGASFDVGREEFVGLVGESGCGKSTLARIIMGLIRPDKGTVSLDGDVLRYPYRPETYKNLQMVFQLPKDSFDPRKSLGRAVTDVQMNFGADRKAARAKTMELLGNVGLNESFYNKYPHEVSGGECQRAAIARSLAAGPSLLICDEVTSALDVSVQAQIMELLKKIKEESGISVLFISHDIALVSCVCDRIMVMNNGYIVEQGRTEDIITSPKNEYTKTLISSIL